MFYVSVIQPHTIRSDDKYGTCSPPEMKIADTGSYYRLHIK